LMQIAILVTTVTFHFKQYEYNFYPNNQVMPCEPTIIERNITEIVYLANTT
ncbi:neuraminidase, partial [Influenza A virus]